MQSELMEATDKATFLRWLVAESLVAGLDDAEINRICQRWIKGKIAAAREITREDIDRMKRDGYLGAGWTR